MHTFLSPLALGGVASRQAGWLAGCSQILDGFIWILSGFREYTTSIADWLELNIFFYSSSSLSCITFDQSS